MRLQGKQTILTIKPTLFGFFMCSKDGKRLYFNLTLGYIHNPVNSFARHQISFHLNFPQNLKGVFMDYQKGIRLDKVWGSQIERLALDKQ
jgi:hypothetical protein